MNYDKNMFPPHVPLFSVFSAFFGPFASQLSLAKSSSGDRRVGLDTRTVREPREKCRRRWGDEFVAVVVKVWF